MIDFELDGTLESVSHPIGLMRICELRLLDDTRWPWLMLVPQRAGCEDLQDLGPSDLAAAMEDMRDAANCLKKLGPCNKINVGSLGNMVRQLHIHVIARNEGDPNWPGPVWGFEKSVLYGENARNKMIASISKIIF